MKATSILSEKQLAKLEEVYNQYSSKVEGITSFKDAPVVDVNPFLHKLSDKMEMTRKVKKTINSVSSVDIIDRDSGEIVSGADENRVFVKREIVDNEKFIKLYRSRIKEMFNMSHSAMKVMGYFWNEMQKTGNMKTDMIYFFMDDCMRFCGYTSHAMVYRGLTELITQRFIAKSNKPGYFYMDSSMGFNGDRLVIMEEYIKQDEDYFASKKALGEK
jgi:hypothetical protein